MFEPLIHLTRAGEDLRSEAETERYIVDDSVSHLSEDHKTEKNFTPRFQMSEDNSIIHRKGQMLVILFYSAYNKSCINYFSFLENFLEIEAPIRIIAINYDPSDAPVTEMISEIPESNKYEFFSIDSWSLVNTHLEKYSLNSLPKLLVVNKRGIINFFGKPGRYDFESQEEFK